MYYMKFGIEIISVINYSYTPNLVDFLSDLGSITIEIVIVFDTCTYVS